MPSRIFVLEDNPSMARMVAATLSREGWETSVHGLIDGALQAFAAFQADLALLDVELPDGEGFEVCAQIRADPAFADIPIVFMTARGSLEDRLRGFSAGAQDYIHKPFDTPELVARLRAHLAQRAREDGLRHQVEAASLRERIRQDVFDMVIHDLRTPLSSLKISLDLLRDGGHIDAASYARIQELSCIALDQAMLMIDDLLELKSGKLKPQRRAVDLAILVEKLRRMLRPQFEHRAQEFRTWVAEDARQVCSDPSLLFRILANLVNNAYKYAPKGKAVELRLSRSGPALRCEVLDEGPGVPDAEKGLIFEKFYRANAAMVRSGAGLGLHLVKRIVERHNGTVAVASPPGQGATFTVRLPSHHDAS